ncbi:MAG: glycosyltransferase family 39 protein [Gammaproteobacteria bacterium]|nr:glycosyltransferase family 39 protein [Gammaproteobacteria bacterium]
MTATTTDSQLSGKQPGLPASSPKGITPVSASMVLVLFMTALHLILAFKAELGGDEAHYALYGLMPDWSYFDHPPMVGWLQIIPMWLAPYDWSARLVPITLYVLLNGLLYQVTVQLFSSAQHNREWSNASELDPNYRWIGFWSLVLLNTSLLLPLMGMAMLPDNPLMVVTLALILVVIKLLKTDQFKYWIALGLLVGLAGLSKYTAVTLVVSLLLLMAVENRFYWLRQKGLWIAIAIAIAMMSPVLYWNAIHDWASFIYQIDHGTKSDFWSWARVGKTQLIQFASYTPLLFLLGWWAMLNPKHYRHAGSRLLLLFSLPITVLFFWGSGYEESLPHWVSLAWLLLIPIIVYQLWSLRQRIWVKALTAVQIVLFGGFTLLMHSLLFSPWIAVADHQNPVQGDYGWPTATQTALELQKQHATPEHPLPLFVPNWSIASHLAWYARPQPVYITSAKQTQFEFWYGRATEGMDGILVAPHFEQNPPMTGTANHFKRCDLLKKQPISANGAIIVTYHFYHCQHFLTETAPVPSAKSPQKDMGT